jgi:hypothetical protein
MLYVATPAKELNKFVPQPSHPLSIITDAPQIAPPSHPLDAIETCMAQSPSESILLLWQSVIHSLAAQEGALVGRICTRNPRLYLVHAECWT